jgi:hypothetical protein
MLTSVLHIGIFPVRAGGTGLNPKKLAKAVTEE